MPDFADLAHRVDSAFVWDDRRIIDPEHEILTVHRLGAEGYVNALTAGVGDTVRAPLFDSVDISISALFGHDDPG